MKTGIELISEERNEQLTKHHRSVEEDVQQNGDLELIQAALFCIDRATPFGKRLKTFKGFPASWNLAVKRKLDTKDDIGLLTVAGALIAAEIDRRQRIKPWIQKPL